MAASGLLIGLFGLAVAQSDAPPAKTFVVSLASDVSVLSASYPAQAVWQNFASFCVDTQPTAQGWDEFQPEPDTPVYNLAQGRTSLAGRSLSSPAKAYRKNIAGRLFDGLKRTYHVARNNTEHCEVFDFSMTDKLDADTWKCAVGNFSKIESRDFTQSFSFEPDPPNSRHLHGTINLHQPGYFTPLDAIGFTGLQLIAISKDSE